MDTSSKLYSTNATNPMGEAVGTSTRSREMENLSLEISRYPRDLLQGFLAPNKNQSSSSTSSRLDDPKLGGDEADEDEGGLNLGLGLSLGGKFGVDKSLGGLKRSSSVVGTMPLMRENETMAPPPPAAAHHLVRTSSLPLESEEEFRKRKEMQTLRRMEAKRRRTEKQRMLREGGGAGGSGGEERGAEGVSLRGRLEREQQCLGLPSKASPPNLEVKRRRTTFGSLQGFLMAQAQTPQGCSQVSGESQGGSSSESKAQQGSSSCGEARSPASFQSVQDRGSQDSTGPSPTSRETAQRASVPEVEDSPKRPESSENKRRETGGSGSGMEDMPCVFTIGDGPNGRKVEGILYKYGKGEEVRIMCVCHGNFFSPSEFVKHAGGRDVEHPLRHIVVSPSASAFQ